MNAETMVGESPQETQDRTAQWARIPRELRDRAQWCVAAPDKSPWTVSGCRASSTDSTTWATFEAACAAATAKGWHVGYMLHADDPFVCVDLDVCDAESQARKGQPIDPTKWMKPEAIEGYRAGIAQFDSYAEQSAHGKGFHIWVLGNIGPGRKRDGVEVYSQERFIVCTGNVVWDRPIAERPAQLATLLDSMRPKVQAIELPPDPADADADWYVAQIAHEDTGEMGRLFNTGEWQGKYQSQSDADLALVKMLARLTDSNRECWSAFRISALGKREKAARHDYMRSTLLVARSHLANDAEQLAHGQQIANALMTGARVQNPHHFRILTDRELQGLPWPRWLVKNIVPEAGVGAIFGDSGTFKSFVALDLLAHISNGQSWFGYRVNAAPCVYIPFEGQGGIPKRVAAWRIATARRARPDALIVAAPTAELTTNIAFITEPMNLRQKADRDKLVTTLTANRWAGGVLCIDTLAQAGGGIEENTSEGMGEMIRIFQELQHRLGGVVLVIHHSGKNKSAGMRGHSSLRGALDFAIECEKAEDAEWNEAQICLDKVKDEQTGKTVPFTMQRILLGNDSDGDEVTSLVVNQPLPQNITEQLTAPPTEVQQNDDDDLFVYEWVKREVTEGKHPSGTSLEGQRAAMKEQGRAMTQKQLRDAVARLKADSLLKTAPVKHLGNAWLSYVDRPETPTEPGVR